MQGAQCPVNLSSRDEFFSGRFLIEHITVIITTETVHPCSQIIDDWHFSHISDICYKDCSILRNT